jgi:hypothetical protein
MQEADLAGPLVFCLMFGATLLATGRVQFGYIYGVAMLGCVGLYTVLNLMSTEEMTLGLTASVLGYCLLPMVVLSAIGIVLTLKSVEVLLFVGCFWLSSPLPPFPFRMELCTYIISLVCCSTSCFRGAAGAVLSVLSVLWCAHSASKMFAAVSICLVL